MSLPKVAFICVHNSCRSQMAEAPGRKYASDVFESYPAGTALKERINPDAVRLMKQLHGIDMERNQKSKTIDQIPRPEIVVSMGCLEGCPYIGRAFDEDWQQEDPTGKPDEQFIAVIRKIEGRVLELKERIAKEGRK